MNSLEKMMAHNQEFVAEERFRAFQTASKFPMKKMVVVSCMDTRLLELLPAAMNIQNGDVKIIKVAGGMVNHPFGSVMRSIVVAVHELGAEEVFVVAHEDCGMASIDPERVIQGMIDHDIPAERIATLESAGIKITNWLTGFEDVSESVRHSCALIRRHPLIPDYVKINGLVIHPETGELRVVVDGSE